MKKRYYIVWVYNDSLWTYREYDEHSRHLELNKAEFVVSHLTLIKHKKCKIEQRTEEIVSMHH